MPLPSIESDLGSVAAAQHGLATDVQLRAMGISERAIQRRIVRGLWIRADRGVIRVAGTPETWESRVLTHVLAAGRGAVASHRTAAVLHQLDGYSQGEPELTVPLRCRFDRAGVRTHRSTDLDRITPTRIRGIPATGIERTLLDLGAVVSPRRVQFAVDEARRRRLTDWDRLLRCLELHARRGRDGVGTLREILDQHHTEVAVTDSGFERLVLVRLAEAGLPPPVLQHQVVVLGGRFRLDLAYPEKQVGIELDGSIHLQREVWERDHARQNALILAGWRLLRFTWQDYRQRPARMISEIRAAIRAS